MKTSQVFIRAKNFLSTGPTDYGDRKTEYICYAIDRTRCSKTDKDRARDIIMDLLDDNYTLGSWLRHVKGIENDRHNPKMQATRHAWIDHLIEYYESIGD